MAIGNNNKMNFFALATQELAELPLDEDIHALIAKHLALLAPKTVVYTTSYNNQTDDFHVRQIQGIGPQMRYLADLLGIKRQRILPPVDRQSEVRLRTGELDPVEGGFYELGFKAIPHFVCEEIEKLLKLDRAYEIGFFWQHEIFGTAVIYLHQDQTLDNAEAIQYYAQLVSITLHQRAQQVGWSETEAKLEGQVSSYTRKLQTTSRERFDLDAAVSHEIMAVAGELNRRAELLQNVTIGDATQLERQQLLEIERIGTSVLNMGQGMLDLAALKAGKLKLAPEPLAIRETVHESLRELSMRAHEKGILLVVEVQPSLPPVSANKDGLQHVIGNLVLNAIKFTPPGGVITVRANCEDGWGYISVTDTGIGIKAVDQAKVFEPFYHPKNQEERRFNGAGLGLTMVRELMEQMQGSVELRSKPSKGSTFTVALPLADARAKVKPR
jgi:signal transduction histidine kinase